MSQKVHNRQMKFEKRGGRERRGEEGRGVDSVLGNISIQKAN